MNDAAFSAVPPFRCGGVDEPSAPAAGAVPDWSSFPSVGVAVFAGGPESYLVEVAERWARFLCPFSYAVDVHVVSPSGPSWTVGELDELVVAPAGLAPEVQHVFVLARADSIPQVDRLLKVLEEPPAPTLWVLCVADVDALKPTVRSRASVVLALRAGPPPNLVALLEQAGVDAARAVAVFADVDDVLGDLAAGAVSELNAVLAAFMSTVESPSPLSAAVLSNTLGLWLSAAGCDTPVRRRCQRACLSAFHTALVGRLEQALRVGADPTLVGRAADVFDRSKVAVAAYGKLDTHLAASSLAARVAFDSVPARR